MPTINQILLITFLVLSGMAVLAILTWYITKAWFKKLHIKMYFLAFRVLRKIKKKLFWLKIFRKSSRQVKRNTFIWKKGKKYKASIYLRELAGKMPVMIDASTGNKIDHYKNLTAAYNKDHIKGIQKYVREVTDFCKKQLKKQA